MNEFGAALQFFDGFGENWYALEECLCYLDEWLPAQLNVGSDRPDAVRKVTRAAAREGVSLLTRP